MPKKYDAATRERAVRMFHEQASEYASVTAACAAVAARLGLPKDTVRGWVRQGQQDSTAGVSTPAEREEIKVLRVKVRRLEEDNAVLRAAATFFASMSR
jgi:transposase-like protein